MDLHCPERVTETEKEKEQQRSRGGSLGPLGWGGADNIQAVEQGHFSFQTSRSEATQIGPHRQSELPLTALSNSSDWGCEAAGAFSCPHRFKPLMNMDHWRCAGIPTANTHGNPNCREDAAAQLFPSLRPHPG